MFEGVAEDELLDVMSEAQRVERQAFAREVLAIGRFTLNRMEAATGEHDFDVVDDWDVTAAEVGAQLGVGRGRAATLMDYGITLIDHLPKLAAEFAAGELDWRILSVILYRTELIKDPEAWAAVDELLADRARHWTTLSYQKLVAAVDWLVLEVDPEAVRARKDRDADRHINVAPDRYGMAEVEGKLRAADGAALDAKLDALAGTVCREDPRTKSQRRADAISALVAGADRMACMCGTETCTAGDNTAASPVVINVIAEQATLDGTSDKPGYLSGFGPIPAATVAEVAKTAKLRPIVIPKDSPAEPQYQPSAGLARFVRARDLTCRWMGCDRPAYQSDIDHTVPWPYGPTHPSNNGCFCRFHHLLKTFYTGPNGWTTRQHADGRITFTSPAGRAYTTEPFGAMLFPRLTSPTGQLDLRDAPPPGPNRGLKMPKRTTTRAQKRAQRIQTERNINKARYDAPPPF